MLSIDPRLTGTHIIRFNSASRDHRLHESCLVLISSLYVARIDSRLHSMRGCDAVFYRCARAYVYSSRSKDSTIYICLLRSPMLLLLLLFLLNAAAAPAAAPAALLVVADIPLSLQLLPLIIFLQLPIALFVTAAPDATPLSRLLPQLQQQPVLVSVL